MCECKKITKDSVFTAGRKKIIVHKLVTKDEAPKYDHPHNPTPNDRDKCFTCGETHDDWSPEAREAAAKARSAGAKLKANPDGSIPRGEGAKKNAAVASFGTGGASFGDTDHGGVTSKEKWAAIRGEAKGFKEKLAKHGIETVGPHAHEYGYGLKLKDPSQYAEAARHFAEHTGENHPDDVEAAVKEYYASGAHKEHEASERENSKYDH
jgi:hypothetical protein